jgi:hypothetical protein
MSVPHAIASWSARTSSNWHTGDYTCLLKPRSPNLAPVLALAGERFKSGLNQTPDSLRSRWSWVLLLDPRIESGKLFRREPGIDRRCINAGPPAGFFYRPG